MIKITALILIGALCFSQPILANEPITPIQPAKHLSPAKVQLGKLLFFDKRLSADNSIACASCHKLNAGGVDHLTVAMGIHGQKGERNTPTVFNASLNFVQFWDGRAQTLSEQALGPITNPFEMGSSWPEIIKKLKSDPHYTNQFQQIYRKEVTPELIADAIAEFERSLLTPNSRFDLYLNGDKKALSPDELEGYQLFKAYGCIACHQGIAIGGNLYEKLGVVEPYFTDPHKIKRSDLGRYNITKKEEHRYQFKVPSLRNIALTAPYLHDGSVPNLESMVKLMGRHQLGLHLTDQETKKIVSFLKTLTGKASY